MLQGLDDAVALLELLHQDSRGVGVGRAAWQSSWDCALRLWGKWVRRLGCGVQ